MKAILFSLMILLAGGATVRADYLLKPNDFLGICGDSITEQLIYSVDIEDYLLMCQPTPGLRVAQFGWSGETVPGFLKRLDSDLFPFHTTAATLDYGMNDGGYRAMTPEIGHTYRTNLTAAIDAMKAHGINTIVVGSPKCVDSFYFRKDPAQAAVYNQTLKDLADIAHNVAQQENLPYADVYGATLAAMEKSKASLGENYNFGGGDGIHPGPNGHLVMAYAMLKALGCDGAIGTLTVDLAANQATGTPGQKIDSFKDGVLSVESTRYPFCFHGIDPRGLDPGATYTIAQYFPFNEDLNRYLLVVKGLKTARAKVTWGKLSKDFSAADLEKGINLANEFPDNPFTAPFFAVETAVREQQTREVFLVKGFLHNLKTIKELAPSHAEALDQAAAEAINEGDKGAYEAAAALVVPVKYTITITTES